VLRRADAILGRVLTKARTRGVGVLRQQINGLQGGLKKLSGGLEGLDGKPRADSRKRVERPATASKPARTRKPKKVA